MYHLESVHLLKAQIKCAPLCVGHRTAEGLQCQGLGICCQTYLACYVTGFV